MLWILSTKYFLVYQKEMPKQRTTTKELDQLLQLLQEAMQDKPKSSPKKKNSSFTPQQQLAMVRIGKEKIPTSAPKQKKQQKKQQQEQQMTLDQLIQYTDPSKWNKKK